MARSAPIVRLLVDARGGAFVLDRWDVGKAVPLAHGPLAGARQETFNRLELACVGGTIAASVNGMQITRRPAGAR